MTKRSALLKLGALLAAGVLVIAGCDRRGPQTPASSGATAHGVSTAPTSGGASTAPADVITPETIGKPLRKLKIGEAATYSFEGITITVRVNSFKKADSAPPELRDDTLGCGQYWTSNVTVTLSGKNITYPEWSATPIVAIGAILDDLPELDKDHSGNQGSSGNDSPDNLIRRIAKVQDANAGKTEFGPVTVTGDEYYPNCLSRGMGWVPRDTTPLGLLWTVWTRDGDDAKKAADRSERHADDAVIWLLDAK